MVFEGARAGSGGAGPVAGDGGEDVLGGVPGIEVEGAVPDEAWGSRQALDGSEMMCHAQQRLSGGVSRVQSRM